MRYRWWCPRFVVPLALVLTVVPALASRADPAAAAWAPAAVAPGDVTAISALPGGIGFAQETPAGGGPRQLLRTADFGLTWTTLPMPGAAATSVEVRFGSARSGAGLVDGAVAVTRDGGRSWTPPTRIPLPYGERVEGGTSHIAVYGQVIVLAGSAPGRLANYCSLLVPSVVAVSTDGARHWRVRYLPTNMQVIAISVLDGRHIVVAARHLTKATGPFGSLPCSMSGDGTTVVYRSTNGGRSFARILATRDSLGQVSSVAYVSARRIVAGFTDGSVTTSDDGGRTFRVRQSLCGPVFDGLRGTGRVKVGVAPVTALAFAGRTGYAYVVASGIWRSTDGGAHWSQDVAPDAVTAPGQIDAIGTGTLAAFDADHALAGGAKTLEVRIPV